LVSVIDFTKCPYQHGALPASYSVALLRDTAAGAVIQPGTSV